MAPSGGSENTASAGGALTAVQRQQLEGDGVEPAVVAKILSREHVDRVDEWWAYFSYHGLGRAALREFAGVISPPPLPPLPPTAPAVAAGYSGAPAPGASLPVRDSQEDLQHRIDAKLGGSALEALQASKNQAASLKRILQGLNGLSANDVAHVATYLRNIHGDPTLGTRGKRLTEARLVVQEDPGLFAGFTYGEVGDAIAHMASYGGHRYANTVAQLGRVANALGLLNRISVPDGVLPFAIPPVVEMTDRITATKAAPMVSTPQVEADPADIFRGRVRKAVSALDEFLVPDSQAARELLRGMETPEDIINVVVRMRYTGSAAHSNVPTVEGTATRTPEVQEEEERDSEVPPAKCESEAVVPTSQVQVPSPPAALGEKELIEALRRMDPNHLSAITAMRKVAVGSDAQSALDALLTLTAGPASQTGPSVTGSATPGVLTTPPRTSNVTVTETTPRTRTPGGDSVSNAGELASNTES